MSQYILKQEYSNNDNDNNNNCFQPENAIPQFNKNSPALAFHVHNYHKSHNNKLFKARAGTVFLPHGKVRTPVFMPGLLLLLYYDNHCYYYYYYIITVIIIYSNYYYHHYYSY